MAVNKFIGIGNLGKDPEVKYTASGEAICNFSIACTESFDDQNFDVGGTQRFCIVLKRHSGEKSPNQDLIGNFELRLQSRERGSEQTFMEPFYLYASFGQQGIIWRGKSLKLMC